MPLHVFRRLLLDPTSTEGGGGNPPPKEEGKGPDLVKAIEGLLAKNGNDPNAALRVLLSENYGYRDQLRDLRGKLPAEGHVVLDPDKAKLFAAYQQYGTPDEIKQGLYERDEHANTIAAHARAKQIGDVAKLHGMDPDVLTTLAGDLEFEIQDAKDKTGKEIKVATVKDGDKSVPLDEFAKAKWEKFLPSLKPTQTRPHNGSPLPSGDTPPKPVITPTKDAPRRSLVR